MAEAEPDGSGIEIGAQVINGDIGFVAEVQAVEIKLQVVPFTLYDLVKGRVRRLGRNAATGGSNGAVPVSAEIRTGKRRVIEYLPSTVLQAVQEAGRER
ncbi:hypothetical protein [Methylobacterium gossipiicola]|uniref:Hemolysin D/membrane fusion protein, RTX toxin transport system n=1 Tax=Methylobacterium gossipiicola TaxID=582675 RepID=A0A1I2VG41_9HYPH|nr:hypothetical protein [Methylobacterium gossipiicola]SFG88258.1 hemolysin D/membrane fusion protein, RTX toxin transport system [Methylobacterium gossipiicola]